METVERQLANIDRRLGQMGTVPHAEASEATRTLADMRELLDRFRPGATLDTMERRMEDLSSRIERGLGPTSSTLIEDLARRVDDIHTSLRTQPSADTRPVEALIRGIAERIEEAREASADIGRLEDLMKTLTAKIESGGSHADTRAITSLEAQISRLGDRLERSETSLSGLDAVEHSLSELFSQLKRRGTPRSTRLKMPPGRPLATHYGP